MWHRLGKGGRRKWGRRGAGIMFTDGHAVLLLKRSEKGDEPNTWTCPGGKVEDGETDIGAAQREVREETGHLLNCTRLGKFDHQDGRFHFTTFLCRVAQQFHPKLSDEHTAYKWVSLDEVPNMRLHPGLRDIWSSMRRTIEEKAGTHKEELEEGVINNLVMSSRNFKAWEMERYLAEGIAGFGGGGGGGGGRGPASKRFGPVTFSPELQHFAQVVANELELPTSDAVAMKALMNILVRLTPPPIGLEEGGMVRVDWFETVIDAIIKSHISGGKLDHHSPAIRQAANPIQLLRTLRTYMPDDNFNPNVSLEGAAGNTAKDRDAYFRSASEKYDFKRNLPAPPPPATPPTPPTPPGGGGGSGGGGHGGGSGGPGTDLVSYLDILPDMVFVEPGTHKRKPMADLISFIRDISINLGNPVVWKTKEVDAYLKSRGI